MNALERAISICGTQAELARRIGGNVLQQHVWNWAKRGAGKVPAEHCIAIEAATEGEVTRYELRPDVFGDGAEAQPPQQQQAAYSPRKAQWR